MYIDTHAHLYAKEFDEDRSEVIKRALRANVQKIILPNIDQRSYDGMMELVAAYPQIAFPAIGIHPCDLDTDLDAQLQWLTDKLETGKYVAIGETGIDLYWDKSNIENQKKAFRRQLQLAKKHKLPIIVHARDSWDQVFDIVESEHSSDLCGVFHCFTGTLEQANRALDLDFYIGIGGVSTFKNSHLPQVIEAIPMACILLETDAPYLAPVPMRGKRNESAYIPHIATKIAEIKISTVEAIALTTTANAQRLFKI